MAERLRVTKPLFPLGRFFNKGWAYQAIHNI
jgi:hypothetical protein